MEAYFIHFRGSDKGGCDRLLNEKAEDLLLLTSSPRPLEKMLTHPAVARDQTKRPGSVLTRGLANLRPAIQSRNVWPDLEGNKITLL